MPTKREREYYRMGFRDGQMIEEDRPLPFSTMNEPSAYAPRKPKPKRKLSAWNKFVKANSKKKEFRYANGKLKLKKMGIAFRKKRR